MFLCVAATPLAQAAERLDAIAAVVNGVAVTCYEVDVAKAELQKQLQQKGVDLPSDAVLFDKARDGRVMRALQHQEAQQLELKISPDEVDAAIKDVEKRNNLQAGQLEGALKAQGIDMPTYRENLEDRLLNTRLINIAVRSKVSISEEAMREYYRKNLKDPKAVREVRLAQIFVAMPAEADAKTVEVTRQKADVLYQRIQAGGDFESMATLDSDAPNARDGGDMGWVTPGAVSGAFAQVFDLKLGETTPPLRSAAGFHIVKVMDERVSKPANMLPYEEVHARHILIKVPESSDLNTQIRIRARVEKIAKEMQGTSDEAFAVRAKELSQGPSAAQGGDLGWFKRGRMIPAFDDAVFAMKPGETSGVVSTDFGLHVIRLVEKRTVNPNSFEAYKPNIEQLLIDTEMQQQVPRWMNGLKAKANIELRTCKGTTTAEPNKHIADELKAKPVEKTSVAKQEADDEAAKMALIAWIDAWEAQDMEAYFAAYAGMDSPDQRFTDFKKWKAYKQRVIPQNKDINIAVSNFETEVLEPGKAVQITFDQHYQSKKFDDYDRKVIVMNYLDGDWKIISEATSK